MSEEYLGVIGHRKPRESRVGDGVVGYEYKEPVEEIPEVTPVVMPPTVPLKVAPPSRKPRLFYLLEQVLGQLGLLTDEVIKLRPRPTPGIYYNSGVKTITTATAANLDQPTPPRANYPNLEEIYDTMHRTATITVINEGPGDIFMLVTSNGATWTTVEIKLEFAERVIIDDAYQIALRTSLANTKYIATEYPTRTSKTIKYSAGNPFVQRDVVAVAGVPVILNINTVIGSNAHTGTVSNLSAIADLFVELSSDGVTFTDNILLSPQLSLDLEGEDVHSVRLDASANATPYQVIAH